MYHVVSIIVPVYKVEPYLRRCIESILAQTYHRWELILVDDGSPDHCPDICDEYAKRNNKIKVIHKANGGLSDARNCGLDMATGDYILFVDSDDYIHYNMVAVLLAHAVNNDADIVQCRHIRGNENHFPSIKEDGKTYSFNNRNIFSSTLQQPTQWGKLYKRSLWEGLRMPVGIIHEDEAITWKLYYKSRKIIVVDTPYYYYYKNPHGIMESEGRRFNPILSEIYNERICYFEKQSEFLLAILSRWQFCLPLAYLYLRGNLTPKEEKHLHQLLRDNIKAFIHCSQVPLLHRCTFFAISICPPLFRTVSILLGKAHTIHS